MKQGNDHFDKKISGSLKDFEYDFDESSWEKMSEKLERDSLKATFFNKYSKVLWVLVILFLAGTATHYGLYRDTEEATTGIVKNEVKKISEISTGQTFHGENNPRKDTDPESVMDQVAQKNNPEMSGNSFEQNVTSPPDQKQGDVTDSAMSLHENRSRNDWGQSEEEEDPENTLLLYKSQLFFPVPATDRPYRSEGLHAIRPINGRSILGNLYADMSENNIFDIVRVEAGSDLITLAAFRQLQRSMKKKERHNAREIRRKLGGSYSKAISRSDGSGLDLKPDAWGIRGGIGLHYSYRIPWQSYGPIDQFEVDGLNLGVYVLYNIHKRFHLQTELAYSRVASVSKFISFSDFALFPSQNRDVYYAASYYLTSLDLFDVQSVIQYKLPGRSTFEAGLSFGLVKPRGRRYFDISDDWDGSVLKPRPLLQLPDPVRDYNLQIILGYEYAISRRFSASFRGYVGLLDLVGDSRYDRIMFSEYNMQSASRIQFSLKINLNKIQIQEEE